jgi:hypothetical protein
MSQVTNTALANTPGATFRSGLNGVLAALQSANSGATAPTTTVAGMFWFDTSTNPATLKQRNIADNGWQFVLTGADVSADIDFAVFPTLLANRETTKLLVDTSPLGNGALGTLGVTATAVSDGTASGTHTPSPATGNFRLLTNNAAFTLAAPVAAGDYTIIILLTNSTTPGAVTFSGFTKVAGDSLTVTTAHKFLLQITKLYSES